MTMMMPLSKLAFHKDSNCSDDKWIILLFCTIIKKKELFWVFIYIEKSSGRKEKGQNNPAKWQLLLGKVGFCRHTFPPSLLRTGQSQREGRVSSLFFNLLFIFFTLLLLLLKVTKLCSDWFISTQSRKSRYQNKTWNNVSGLCLFLATHYSQLNSLTQTNFIRVMIPRAKPHLYERCWMGILLSITQFTSRTIL